MLTADDMIRIYKEAALQVDATLTTPEALEYRKKMDTECDEIRKSGGTFDIPHEVPG